jgi:hypothetical protein
MPRKAQITFGKIKDVQVLVRLRKDQHDFIRKFSFDHRISITEVFRRYVDWLRKNRVQTKKGLLGDEENIELSGEHD